MESTCPQCHVIVRPTDYFCYNCGKNLRPEHLSESVETLAKYYIGSILLPPMGIVWGMRYVRQGDRKGKMHGYILIIMTVLELMYLTIWTVNFINQINAQVNSQLNLIQ